MISIFPEQLQALQNILNSVAASAAALHKVKPERVERFRDQVTEFVEENAGSLSNHIYLFLFDGSTASDGPCVRAVENYETSS